MKYTNKHNLPESFVDFATNDKYSKGNSDITVTTLIDSPRIRLMKEHHKNDIQEDVIDRVWALLGTAVHYVLESSIELNRNKTPCCSKKKIIYEERLFSEVDGWVLSGAIDSQNIQDNKVSIVDYKVTSVWSVIYGKKEWEEQLNCYAYLVSENKKLGVKSIQICAILRDWIRRESENRNNYPKIPVTMVDIPVWSDEKRQDFIKGRMKLHQEAQQNYERSGEFPLCTRSDRWFSEDIWAIHKGNNKRALKLCKTEQDAKDYIRGLTDHNIKFREGKPARCSGNYCGVAEFCSQYNGENNE